MNKHLLGRRHIWGEKIIRLCKGNNKDSADHVVSCEVGMALQSRPELRTSGWDFKALQRSVTRLSAVLGMGHDTSLDEVTL